MDLALQCKIFTTSELEMINACRLYLQVSSISDIAIPDSRRILHKMLHGEYTIEEIHAFRKTTYDWPIQAKPNSHAWTKWHLALTKIACNHVGLLTTPLGPWHDQIEQSWKYWIAESGESLFKHKTMDWQLHPLQRGGLTARYSLESTTVEQPRAIYPAIPITRNQWLICPNHKSTRINNTKKMVTYSTFQEYLRNNTEQWEKHLHKECMEIAQSTTRTQSIHCIRRWRHRWKQILRMGHHQRTQHPLSRIGAVTRQPTSQRIPKIRKHSILMNESKTVHTS
eukprot:scaffold97599_cov32-Attheya_sp.AAC.4